jgi:hypothetical protein
MSVPTFNLYDWMHQVLEKRYWLIYFFPWGSKDLSCAIDYFSDQNWHSASKRIINSDDLLDLFGQALLDQKNWASQVHPVLFCHDQEPLNYELYTDQSLESTGYLSRLHQQRKFTHYHDKNLRYVKPDQAQSKWILLHSEQNSVQVDRYNADKFVCAYWWSHAMLAKDWYRYAQHDTSLGTTVPDKLFLIYARDFSGTRQYRQTFLSNLADLHSHCQIGSVNSVDVNSESSAVYDADDFNATEISVVLETLFADPRIHLTEKTLRPIACGHPFILAAGPGSLGYLRNYGFQTFSPWINEAYDNEPDHDRRMYLIIEEMKRLAAMPQHRRQEILQRCREIAKQNQQYFFSAQFDNQIVDELKINVARAKLECAGLDAVCYFENLEQIQKQSPGLEIPLTLGMTQLLEKNQSH